jgi:DNA modification methylase
MTATFNLLLGDCLERLKELPDNSIDSIVTDPPYGLSKQPDMVEVLKCWLAGEDYKHNSKGFMGKEWDSFVPGPTIWKECYRVLKPGGHMVAFFGTRTYDIGVLAIRLAGFEIRNQLAWVFGSGFPKSLDVSKAIDKTLGAEREVVGKKTYGDGHIQNSNVSIGFGGSDPEKDNRSITTPATGAAKQWEGWGTDLKPAMEPIVLARKPLEGTVAQNVMKHGVGGINIDGCRVEAEGETISNHGRNNTSDVSNAWGARLSPYQDKEQTEGQKLGRFPANFIHDGSDEVVSLFPDSKGQIASVKGTESSHTGQNGIYGNYGRTSFEKREEDDLSAGRFFYCAKTSKKDRNEGLDHLPDKEWRQEGAAVPERKNRPFIPSKNNHPTVKPTALMEYLCRLITPEGGTILDPFMGSGSTGKAAMYEGFNFVGVELLQEHMEIAEARIAAAKKDAYEISVGLKKPRKKIEEAEETNIDITKFFE